MNRKLIGKCITCTHIEPRKNCVEKEVLKKGVVGECRHDNPSIEGWPGVYLNEWCRKYKQKV